MPEEVTALSAREREIVKRIAARDGVSEEEAASRLVKEGLARRVRRKSGKGQAKVFPIRRGAK